VFDQNLIPKLQHNGKVLITSFLSFRTKRRRKQEINIMGLYHATLRGIGAEEAKE
jgi:hypothetical protein